MNEKTCYFAHHVSDYDSERESAAVKVIESYGYDVVNPNSPEDDAAYKERGMIHFTERVLGCAALAFQRFPDGKVGAGVAKEIATAAKDNKPVFEVTDDAIFYETHMESIEGAVLTVDETRERLRGYRAAKAAEL
jgi:hypothetical protein